MPTYKVCLLGGTGFVGHSIAAKLSKAGHYTRIISRRRERHRDLLVLPNCHVVDGDVHNPADLKQAFTGMDVVINLVGILNEKGRRGKGFEKVHTDLPKSIIEVCKTCRISRVLHMSALHAALNAPSHYLRSKAHGEDLLHDAGKRGFQITTFRPSVIFGPNDSFLNRFAKLLQWTPGWFPLACAESKFQPIYVEDVAQAFVAALTESKTIGQRYDLCGPKKYTLLEIVQYIDQLQGGRHKIIALGKGLSKLQAGVLEFFPGKPFSLDNYRSLQVDSVCRGGFPKIFNIVPMAMEVVAPRYIGTSMHKKLDSIRQEAGRRG